MHDGMWLPGFAVGPLSFRYRRSYQFPNTGRVQVGRLSDSNVANPFALAAQQFAGIRQQRAEIESEVEPVGMGRGEDEGVAWAIRETEVVCDRVYLVHKLTGFGCLFKDEFSRGERELLNRLSVRQEQLEILRIGWTQAHRASVTRTNANGIRSKLVGLETNE